MDDPMGTMFLCVACSRIFAAWESARDEDADADACPYCGSLWVEEWDAGDGWDEPECDEG